MSSPAVPAKKLINRPEDVVEEAVQGMLAASPGTLRRLEGLQVLIRADYKSVKEGGKVAILSGGGSGHEPAHAGYIGPGMLTGAICGGVFASPSVASILAAIREVTGPAGTLLVVKNYTGDRLNFGMAREKALAEGLQVEMILVADDCALPKSKGITGRRGVAGTVLVHKVAGAAADAGLSLAEVKAEAEACAAAMGTLGIALTTCTVPGSAPSGRLAGDLIEIGEGIHGEPGMEVCKIQPADVLVDRMINAIIGDEAHGGHDYLPLSPGDRVVLLANNLGGLPPMELSIATRRAVATLEGPAVGARVERAIVGTFMTSLEMAGVSLTICKAVAKAIADARDRLNELDAVSGDGDSGSTLERGAREVMIVLMGRAGVEGAAGLMQRIGEAVGRAMGGTCGALLEILFRAMARSLREQKPAGAPTSEQWAEALSAGVEALQFYGGARPGYRTMVDAWVPTLEGLRAGGIEAMAKGAHEGAERTKTMAAKAGRANYVPMERMQGHADPGAQAVAIGTRALADALKA